jgi:8-oxo-dGTP diphosphatase
MPTPPQFHDFPRATVAVDVVLMTVEAGALKVLVQTGTAQGVVLPGGLVRADEPLEATVNRVLDAKARLPGAYVEQLYTFGAVDRDPRGRVVSVAYFALMPAERLTQAVAQAADLRLATVRDGACDTRLGYDHDQIVRVAVQRLAAKLDYTAVALELLPAEFTLRALQDVYETILSVRLAKPAFRRKMLDRGFLKSTGRFETGGAHRPAELYARA